MIAEVIPYTRTIRGKDHFDYAVPAGMTVAVGDVVDVLFRGKKTYGLVLGVKETSAAARLQEIVGVRDYAEWRDPQRMALLRWFADYYLLSLPAAFRAMQFPLLQRPRRSAALPVAVPPPLAAAAGVPEPVQSPLASVQDLRVRIIRGASHVVRYDQRADCIALYRAYIAGVAGHVLVIVPEIADAHALQQAFSAMRQRHVVVLSSESSPSQWHALLQALHTDMPVLCIATKRGVFLPWNVFASVIIDQEESRAHKQFDGNPRYHVRAVAEWLATHAQPNPHARPTVLYTSHAPSVDRMVHAQHDGDVLLHLSRPQTQEHVQVVDMEEERMNKNFSWFSDALIAAVQSSRKSLLFLNRVGRYGSAMCRDCGALLPVDAAACSQCHGQRIRNTRKGTQELERELRTLFAAKRVLRIDRDQDVAALSMASIDAADIIIGTEKVLHMLPLSYFDCIGVLSVDHLLVYPHFRSQERVYQLLAMLCSLPLLPTIVQTSAPHHPVIRAATHNAYDLFLEQEIAMRKALHLPPFGERSVLINTKTGKTHTVSGPIPPELLTVDTVVDRQ